MSAERQVTSVVEHQDAPAPTTIIQLMERAALDPTVNVDTMERLYQMHERALDRAAKLAFVRAYAAMSPKLPTIDERGQILNAAGKAQSTYAEWEDINDAIGPILNEHGFTLAFRPGSTTDGKVTVAGILRHVEGHEDEATVTLPQDNSGGKNTVQGVGSSLSYGKRYAAIALLNITSRAKRDKDDDGRGAGLSEVAQRSIAAINLSDNLDDLWAWKATHYDGVSKIVRPDELKEIVALYNRRSKTFRAATKPEGADGFPGDRP